MALESIEVNSFVRQDGKLVLVSEFADTLSDAHYVEGAIELRLHGQLILTQDMWDYVDQLWIYIIDGLRQIVEGHDFSTYFPDQPIRFCLSPRQDGMVLVEVESTSRSSELIETNEFVHCMIEAATDFFTLMKKHVPENRVVYDRALNGLTAIARGL
jgi:hypothetical protein